MTIYKLSYRIQELREVQVEAESESAARQCWIDGSFLDHTDKSVEVINDELLSVEEVSESLTTRLHSGVPFSAYRAATIEDGLVFFNDADVMTETTIFVSDIMTLDVDWSVASGKITVTTRSGRVINFVSEANDGGEQAAEVLERFIDAMRKLASK